MIKLKEGENPFAYAALYPGELVEFEQSGSTFYAVYKPAVEESMEDQLRALPSWNGEGSSLKGEMGTMGSVRFIND
jgi:hypothetical protein